MKHPVIIEGERHVLDIRAMDEQFIVWRKLFQAPLTPANMKTADPEYLATGQADGRFPVIEAFFRKQIQTLGSCMILAWDDNGVVGKMHYTTREVAEAISGPEYWHTEACYCVDHGGFAPTIQSLGDETLIQLLRSPSRTLRILCFNIGHTDPRWHGHGIAKAMVRYLVAWARKRDWQRIEAKSCPDITPTSIRGDRMLRRGPLERLGFRVLETYEVSPAQASQRLEEIESFLSGQRKWPTWCDWYAENVHRLAESSDWWLGYAQDYLMGCDLS